MPKPHVVKEGEYLSLIARKLGFVTTKPLLDANPDLFAGQRRSPNVLNPGDELIVPPKREKLVPRPTEQTHTFKLKAEKDRLRLVLRDDEGHPLADQKFTLRVQAAKDAPEGSGLEIPGDLAGGRIDVPLPRGSVTAYLTLEKEPWLSWELHIGSLDPPHEPADKKKVFLKGVQARLNNLGFHCGPVDGVLGPRTRSAIARFQRKKMTGKDPTGDPDPDTCDALKVEHGS